MWNDPTGIKYFLSNINTFYLHLNPHGGMHGIYKKHQIDTKFEIAHSLEGVPSVKSQHCPCKWEREHWHADFTPCLSASISLDR